METYIPIITALVSGCTAAAAAIIAASIQHKKTVALLTYRLGQLEAKVDKHNNLVERTYDLEARADVSEERIKAAHSRIKALEQDRKGC